VSTFRPVANPVTNPIITNRALKQTKQTKPFLLLFAAGVAGVLTLSGCSSKKAADTTAVSAAVETTVAAEATVPETTVASSAESSSTAAVETSVGAEAVAAETTVAAAVATTAGSSDGATPTSVDPQVAMEAAIVSGMSSQLGVTDPKQLACVGDSVKGADFTKPEGQGSILRGILKCAPDAMAVQGAKSLREANPSVTEKQSVCVVKATFEVLSAMADSELVAAMSSSKLSPAIAEATVAKAKGCGLTDAEIRKAIQQ
jgi:hypothetical protein